MHWESRTRSQQKHETSWRTSISQFQVNIWRKRSLKQMRVQNYKIKMQSRFSILFLFELFATTTTEIQQMDINGRLWNANSGSPQRMHTNDWRYEVMISELSHWIHFVLFERLWPCALARIKQKITIEVIKLQSFCCALQNWQLYKMEMANKHRIIDQIQGSNNWFNISFGNLLGIQICEFMLMCVRVCGVSDFAIEYFFFISRMSNRLNWTGKLLLFEKRGERKKKTRRMKKPSKIRNNT